MVGVEAAASPQLSRIRTPESERPATAEHGYAALRVRSGLVCPLPDVLHDPSVHRRGFPFTSAGETRYAFLWPWVGMVLTKRGPAEDHREQLGVDVPIGSVEFPSSPGDVPVEVMSCPSSHSACQLPCGCGRGRLGVAPERSSTRLMQVRCGSAASAAACR